MQSVIKKKEQELFLRDGLPKKAKDALCDLGLNIKIINFKYSTGELSSEKVVKLNKIERLRLVN